MRRILSFVLLAAFSFPLIAPALALGQDPDAGLPACCRRSGAHHCSMKMHIPPSTATEVSTHCPNFPQPTTAPAQISSTALVLTPDFITFEFFLPAAPQQAETQRRISLARAHQKRGPPAVLLD